MADSDISSLPPPPPPLPDLTPQSSPKKEEQKKTSQSQQTPKKQDEKKTSQSQQTPKGEDAKKTSQSEPKPQGNSEKPPQPSASGSTGETAVEEGHSKEENDFLNLGLDLNSYATKKSLAQGILDLALLAANASQLKFILTVGKEHEFYDIILWLVVSSIILQAIQAVLCVVLALVLNLNNVDEQKKANIVNNVGLSIVILIVIVNVIICGFDIKSSNAYFYMIKQNTS